MLAMTTLASYSFNLQGNATARMLVKRRTGAGEISYSNKALRFPSHLCKIVTTRSSSNVLICQAMGSSMAVLTGRKMRNSGVELSRRLNYVVECRVCGCDYGVMAAGDLKDGSSILMYKREDLNTGRSEVTKEREGMQFNRSLHGSMWSATSEIIGREGIGRLAVFGALLAIGIGHLACSEDAGAIISSARDRVSQSNDMRALSLGPEGPLLEEFWDNMRRYGLYFLTVASGGIYSLVKPAVDLLKNPVTAVLVTIVISGLIYLVFLTVSSMLGINEFKYEYAF